MSYEPIVMCPLCKRCRPEELSGGWRLCDGLGLVYLTDDSGVVEGVIETQRVAPVTANSQPPINKRVTWAPTLGQVARANKPSGTEPRQEPEPQST